MFQGWKIHSVQFLTSLQLDRFDTSADGYDRLSTHRPYSLLLIVLLQSADGEESLGDLFSEKHGMNHI
jgi:hypothetical protein